MKRLFSPLFVLTILILLGCQAQSPLENQPLPVLDQGQTDLTPLVKEEAMGSIEGSVSFPSSGLPKDLSVCAASLENREKIYCVTQWNEGPQYALGIGYKLQVPAGLYQVTAQRTSGSTQGFYSAFVVCGQTPACTDHSPLQVSVKAGQTTTGIDPADWYG